ncbi:hypothetical protein F4778DRAFT_410466 [Xylariomycetidae sp. FL2044]|nr:hypothetical protein F4778DRAFT_410466 [Xylariomycetidae sp. FL2044]
MAPTKQSPTPESLNVEDPATAQARKEFKHTAISEKPTLSMPSSNPDDVDSSTASANYDKPDAKDGTPESDSKDTPSEALKEKVSSPKKKRAHDEVDEPKESSAGPNGDLPPPQEANSKASLGRNNRSEPEKKRARDISSASKTDIDASTKPSEPSKTTEASEQKAVEKNSSADKPTEKKSESNEEPNKKGTSASAFSSSGLSGFASQASPFLSAGASKLSSFASSSGSQSPFGAAASSTTSAFGSTNGTSPFGQIGGAPKPFGGSVLGGGFGSTLGGSKMTSFGKPGEKLTSSKPARPFGAPVSEEEDNNDDEEDNTKSSDGGKDDSVARDTEDDSAAAGDDKKKTTKLQRVAVDDGEAGEATILQVRAKLFSIDKASNSWKERGAGNLKINVPLSCVDIDEDTGAAIPGSFDASDLEDSESKVVRLVMRQDSTHRVILNTVVIPAMNFQEKATMKTTGVLFTAIEDDGAVSMQLKMNGANAKSFLNEIGKVQRELQSL